MRNVASNRAATPHRRIADQSRGLGERRRRLLHIGRRGYRRMRRQRSDPNGVAAARDPSQLWDATNIHDGRRRGEPQLHQWNQAVPAGQELRSRVRRQQSMHVSERTSAVVIEIRGIHG